MLAVARISPFRCAACGFRFLSFHPGVRYRRRRVQGRGPERPATGRPCVLEYGDRRVLGQVVEFSVRGCAITTAAAPDIGSLVGLVVRPAPTMPPLRLAPATVRSVLSGRVGLAFEQFDDDSIARLGCALLAAHGCPSSLSDVARRSSRAWLRGALAPIVAAMFLLAALAVGYVR